MRPYYPKSSSLRPVELVMLRWDAIDFAHGTQRA
jgi:hypothetical protein